MDIQKALGKVKEFANTKQGRVAVVMSAVLGASFLVANLGGGGDRKEIAVERKDRKEYASELIDEKTRKRYMEALEAEQKRTQQEVSVLKEEVNKLREMLRKELVGETPSQLPSQPQTRQPQSVYDRRFLEEITALRRALEAINNKVNQLETKIEQRRAPVYPDQVPSQLFPTNQLLPKVAPPSVRVVKPGQTQSQGQTREQGETLLEDFVPAQEEEELEKKLRRVSKRPRICLPQGSFGKVVALSGLSAPTGPRASQDPVPVLFAIPDEFIKPNLKRTAELRNCFALGWGAGDLSSERIKVKVRSISCEIGNERVKIDVQGYIAGPDGKEGIRGILVEKRGQYLAKALMASFVEGLSALARYSTTVVSISPLGATQTVPPEEAFKYGLGMGASKALQRLSDYYLKLADEVLPVIEVGSGVSGTLILLNEACEDKKTTKPWKTAVEETKEKFKGVNLKAPVQGTETQIKPFYDFGGER